MKKRLILVVFLIVLVGTGVLVYRGQRRLQTTDRVYSGTVEATQANLAFQVSGRVAAVSADEGQTVAKDLCLARLDDAEFKARLDQARADLNRSLNVQTQGEAQLALFQATLPAEVEKAAAAVDVLKQQLNELQSGYRAQEIENARLALQSARLAMEEARREQQRYEALYRKNVIAAKEKDAVDLRFETALKTYERAQETHALLKEGYRTESIEAARSRYREGQAALKQASSNLKKIELTRAEIDAARSQVESARALVKLAEIQLGHTCLKAPFAGTILSRSIEPGEFVSPGKEVFTLADLSTVEVKIFVPETEIGHVKPGGPADIRIDTFPQKAYSGRVSFVSSQAEFTPKFIQTHKERVKLVYLVKILLPNPDLDLKPGMPADARLR